MKSGIQTPLYYHSKQLQTKPHQESPRRWVFIQRVALDYQTKCSTRHNWNTICTQAHQHSSPHISIRNICYEQIHSHNIDSNIRESSHSNLAQEVFTTKIQLDSKNNNPNKLGSLFELHPQALSLQKNAFDDSFITAYQQARCNSCIDQDISTVTQYSTMKHIMITS